MRGLWTWPLCGTVSFSWEVFALRRCHEAALAAFPKQHLACVPLARWEQEAERCVAIIHSELSIVLVGVAILQNSVGKTNFKGLADFEDAERQEANKR